MSKFGEMVSIFDSRDFDLDVIYDVRAFDDRVVVFGSKLGKYQFRRLLPEQFLRLN